jgi:B-box zinc finger
VADLLAEQDKSCPTCQTVIKTTDPGKFIKN